MSRIPIKVEKIKIDRRTMLGSNEITTEVKYLFVIEEKGKTWDKTFICEREALMSFRNEIDKLISETTTAEVLKISESEAQIVDKHYLTDDLCQSCKHKLTSKCKECLFILQSPLERVLYLELSKTYIKFSIQYALNWKGENISVVGKEFNHPRNNFKEVFTIADFFIEKGKESICIYTDGHTFHEKTEEQALHDKTIDRKLQELGFTVLRYTGKEIRENIETVIQEIQKWADK